MNCSQCQNQFNPTTHTPRLLIFCGHSLCESCCRSLHANNRIQCPQCASNTFIEDVNFLPKNLALLMIRNTGNSNNVNSSSGNSNGNTNNGHSNGIGISVNNNNTNMYNSVNNNNNTNTNTNTNAYCQKHDKKYQAFCNKQKVLICIDCILQDNHRTHQMSTIKNSYQNQDKILKQSISTLQSLLQKTEIKYEENLQSQKQYYQSYDILNISIYGYFQQLTQLLNREYETVITKVKENHQNYIGKFIDKNSKYTDRLEELKGVLGKFRQWVQYEEIQMLRCVGDRDQMLNMLKIDHNNSNINSNSSSNNGQYDQIVKVTPSVYSNKNYIADIVIKAIQKNYKTSTNTNNSNNNNNNNNVNKAPQMKTKKNSVHSAAQIMKSYQSAQLPSTSSPSNNNNTNTNTSNNNNTNTSNNNTANTNTNNNQNMKPMSKKPVKKQPIVAVASVLPSTSASMIAQHAQVVASKNVVPLTKNNNSNINHIEQQQQKRKSRPVTSTNTGTGTAVTNISSNSSSQQKQKSKPSSNNHSHNNNPSISINNMHMISRNCDISMVQQKQSLFNSFFSNMTSFLNDQPKYIYVVGGFDQPSSNITRFNVNNGIWEQMCQMRTPRSKFGCLGIAGNIWVIGGKKGKERVADVQVWATPNNNNNNHTNNHNNITQGCWLVNQNITNLKKKRSGFGVIQYQHYIYIIGGNDGESILNTVDILNINTGQWTKTEPMIQARDELAVCMGKQAKIYAIGGFGGKNNQPLKTVQMFDIVTQKWHQMPSLNTQRRALAAASLADGIYAIGGFDGNKHLSSVQKYEQDSWEWVTVAPLKHKRCTHSAVSIFDSQEIIVMGGFDKQALDSVEKYSLISNQWEQIAVMPQPRFMHSSILIQ